MESLGYAVRTCLAPEAIGPPALRPSPGLIADLAAVLRVRLLVDFQVVGSVRVGPQEERRTPAPL